MKRTVKRALAFLLAATMVMTPASYAVTGSEEVILTDTAGMMSEGSPEDTAGMMYEGSPEDTDGILGDGAPAEETQDPAGIPSSEEQEESHAALSVRETDMGSGPEEETYEEETDEEEVVLSDGSDELSLQEESTGELPEEGVQDTLEEEPDTTEEEPDTTEENGTDEEVFEELTSGMPASAEAIIVKAASGDTEGYVIRFSYGDYVYTIEAGEDFAPVTTPLLTILEALHLDGYVTYVDYEDESPLSHTFEKSTNTYTITVNEVFTDSWFLEV